MRKIKTEGYPKRMMAGHFKNRLLPRIVLGEIIGSKYPYICVMGDHTSKYEEGKAYNTIHYEFAEDMPIEFFKVGDIIKREQGMECKVCAIFENIVFLSSDDDLYVFQHTQEYLKKYNYIKIN